MRGRIEAARHCLAAPYVRATRSLCGFRLDRLLAEQGCLSLGHFLAESVEIEF